jgi:hypothetical protein
MTVIVGRLGSHCTSIEGFLAQTMGLPITPLHRVKNSPGQLATIKTHALMGLDEVFRKNRTLLLFIITQ